MPLKDKDGEILLTVQHIDRSKIVRQEEDDEKSAVEVTKKADFFYFDADITGTEILLPSTDLRKGLTII